MKASFFFSHSVGSLSKRVYDVPGKAIFDRLLFQIFQQKQEGINGTTTNAVSFAIQTVRVTIPGVL